MPQSVRANLSISELLSTKGEKLVDHYRLPFRSCRSRAKSRDDLRVEHAVRLFIDELHVGAPGPRRGDHRAGHLDVVKAVHRTRGTPVELAFDERGERVDFDKQLAELAQSARR